MRSRHHLTVALVLLLALLAANVPYLYGAAIRPAGTRFWAVPPVNASDANQYLAFTRIAARGHWLIGDPFTSEPVAPALFMPQILFQAELCRAFGWSPMAAFHISRVASGLLLLLGGWWFGAQLLPRRRQRWYYLALLCFSAGAGWFLDHGGWLAANGDFLQPEANTFFTLENLPHLALSSALLTALFAALVALERQPERAWRWLAVTALCAFVLAWTHPFDFLILALTLPVYCAVRWTRSRRFPSLNLLHALVLAAGALPGALYLTWLTHVDPSYRALANDPSQVQSFAYYAAQHGFLALPALLVACRSRLRSRLALPLCWVVCAFLFLLTPFRLGGKQPRVVGGVHVPLAVLAAAGLDSIGVRLRRRRAKPGVLLLAQAATWGYVGLTATGAWGIVERHVRAYSPRGPDYYLRPAVQSVLAYIDAQGTENEVTLGGPYSGGWAPVWANTRVWNGHWQMTLHQEQKWSEEYWFYTAPDERLARSQWLHLRGITWVIWYPPEWPAPITALEGIPGLERVYTSPEIWLYRYRP